jgi:[ribosomal protein S5]-alanine N-acetyltransferase
MGYSLASSHWGQGLTTEAAQAVLDAAFVAYSDLKRIRAMADARNPGSLRVMEKIGMMREGTLRQNRSTRGESIDEVWCGILRREWEARRK